MNTEPRDDRLDHEDLNDAERAAIEAQDDEGNEAGASGDEGEDDGDDDGGEHEAQPAAAQAGESAQELREAAQALREAASSMRNAQPAPAAAPEPAPAPPRDFAAELAELKKQYEDGEIEMSDWMEARDAVRDAQMEARLAAEREAERAARAAQSEQEQAAVWAKTYTEFFASDAEANHRLQSDALKPGFDKLAVGLIAQGMGYAEALVEARKQIFEQLSLPVPGVKTEADAIERAVTKRKPGDRPGPGLGDMPSAGNLQTKAADALDNLPIEDLENRIARMNGAELEAYLAGSEGGLGDHPRGRRD